MRFLLTVFTLLVLAQTARPQASAPAEVLHSRQILRVGKLTICNTGPWTPQTRKEHRPADLWKYYMHGVVDFFTTPVPWSELADPKQNIKQYLVEDQPIGTKFKTSNSPAVQLVKSQRIDFARPIPMDMEMVRGKTIRIFVWLKGQDAASSKNCWHGPDLYVTIKDAEGNGLVGLEGYFQTQGTFPWHCYYKEVFVPVEAAGVYVSLYNKFHGTAWFSTLSWELVTPENTYTNDEKQDPATGSLAFNPKYQEMPYHLKYGYGFRYPWRFVLGAKAGLIGQPYDITTKKGFRKYYFEEAKTEGEHMNHGILYMQAMYRNGTARNMLPPMEPGWLKNFAKILIEDQDPKTGYWHDGTNLSLGLTFHLCDMHFRYNFIPRADRETLRFPDMDLGLKRIPRAKEIIQTTLRQQSSWVDEQGRRRKAAWNKAAYRYTTTPDQYKDKCYLGTTWDAIQLLRMSSNYVGPKTKRGVYDAVKEAFYYVLRHNVLDDGTFKQRDTAENPTRPTYMNQILDNTAWLERRILPNFPRPKVSVKRKGKTIKFTWTQPTGEQNSVRLYAVPKGTPPEEINESYIVGMIHRTGEKIYEMDPLLAVQKIRQATSNRWGGTMELPPADNWRGRRYLPWKLRQIPYDENHSLPHSDNLHPLSLPANLLADKDLYASAVNWYGEESPPLRMDVFTR